MENQQIYLEWEILRKGEDLSENANGFLNLVRETSQECHWLQQLVQKDGSQGGYRCPVGKCQVTICDQFQE